MKILLINEVCGRTSTGRICAEIAARYEAAGHKVKIAYGRNQVIVYKGTACEEILKQYENCGLDVEPGAENLKKGIRILLEDAEKKHRRETVETS